jgi:hypothetical protein
MILNANFLRLSPTTIPIVGALYRVMGPTYYEMEPP